MKSSSFGAQTKNGGLALELLYAITAAAVALAIGVTVPRPKAAPDNHFPACFTNVCFSSITGINNGYDTNA